MGKKKINALSYLYLVGMLTIAIGFFFPIFKILGLGANGFKFINFDNSVFVSLGAILIFIGAAAGVVVNFFPSLKKKNLDFLSLAVSIAGGVVLLIGFSTNGGIYKMIGKALIKNAENGFYMIIAGWIIAIFGYFSAKFK